MFGNIDPIAIILVVAIVGFVWLYTVYVQLIQKKNKVKEALASVDVQLKKRYDLIPNILAIAVKFMEHEKSLIEDVVKLRTESLHMKSNISNIEDKIKLESALQSKMGQLMVSVENYPQLKSNETMVQAMQTFAEVEEQISAARRFYNSAVLELNNSVEIYPSSAFASSMGIVELPFFEITENEQREAVDAAAYFTDK